MGKKCFFVITVLCLIIFLLTGCENTGGMQMEEAQTQETQTEETQTASEKELLVDFLQNTCTEKCKDIIMPYLRKQ